MLVYTSVADPVCLSRIKQQQKEDRKKTKLVKPFFVAVNIIKLQIINSFEQLQKKIRVN